MSLIKFQQSQMSGTLAGSVSDRVQDLLASNRSLSDDLNALRTQIRKIQGTDFWTTELSGSQDLAVIETAMKVDGTTVDFEGDVYVADDAFISGSMEVAETITALVGFSGSLTKLANGGDYIIAGKNISTVTGTLGNIEIVANPGDIANGVQYNVDGYFTANEKFTFTMGTDAIGNPMGKLVMSGTFVQGKDSNAFAPYSQAVGLESTAGKFRITGVDKDGSDLVVSKADLSGLTTPISAYVASGDDFAPVQITIDSITLDGEDSILSISGGGSIPAGAVASLELIFNSYSSDLDQFADFDGQGAVSSGFSTKAWGEYSSARGGSTIASGVSSHAEGGSTKALGDLSHAEGHSSMARGEASHAEGYQTKTGAENHQGMWFGGLRAHAEGANTRAYGDSSHAEGNATFSIGNYSHSEGEATNAGGFEIGVEVTGDSLKFSQNVESRIASLNNAFVTFVSGNEAIALTILQGTQVYDAETDSTTVDIAEDTGLVGAIGVVISTDSSWVDYGPVTVVGESSHAEGYDTRALGDNSHAEGVSSYAIGQYSHAEGINTTTIGFGSHAEGEFSIAKGNGSHVEGYYATSSGNYSHAEGRWSLASGISSHAEGDITTAGGNASHAEGSGSLAMGLASHSEGHLTTAPADYSHAEGWATITSGSWSHAEGKATITSGSWSHAEGVFSIARGEASHAEGSGSLSVGVGSHAEGKDTTALGDFSHAGGVATLASGYGSIAMGFGSVAAGNFSVSAGDNTVASGSYQTVFGRWNKENNSDSVFIIGGGTADNDRRDLMLIGQNTIMMGSASLAADTFFHVATSGAADKAKFDGSVLVDGFVKSESGFSGSLTKLADNTDYLIAGVGISITTGSNGAITISSNTNSTIKGYFAGNSAHLVGNVFTFGTNGANIGTLSVASDEFIDVYLNGVFLSYGTDIINIGQNSFELNANIASELNGTDKISIVLRNLL